MVSHGETGLLVPPRDARELASAIVDAAEGSGARERMGSAGLERVKRLFSADGMVEKTLGVYRNHAESRIRRFGWHEPRSGHSESPCPRLNPH